MQDLSNSKVSPPFKANVYPESTVVMMVITALSVGIFSTGMFFVFVLQVLG